MLEIARSGEGGGVFQKDIAAKQSLSLKYLDHIVHALKTAHLITNSKGRKSGYILTRKPSEITVFDIHRAFEPGICLVDCNSSDYRCDLSEGCLAKDLWGNLNNMIINYFKTITLEDLLNGKGYPEAFSTGVGPSTENR